MIDEEYMAFAMAFSAEHREMRQIVQKLQQVLNHERPWSRELAQRAVAALDALVMRLNEHFIQEEEGGYLEQALAVAPRFSEEAKELLAQHDLMRQQAAETLQTARRSVEVPAAWTALRKQTGELLLNLAAHERAENKIVQHALNTGIETE